MINEVRLIGNIGSEPEIKSGATYKMAKFSLATTSNYKGKNGEWEEKTQWHNIVVFGFGAEHIEKFAKKGTLLYVEGEIEYQQYDKNGETRYYTQIKASKVRALARKKGSEDSYGGGYSPEPPPYTGDDVPF